MMTEMIANPMDRRKFITLSGAAAAGFLLKGCNSLTNPMSSPGRKPNVMVIFTDDQGYGDLGCYGCEDFPTPNIDYLARRGVRCTDGYSTCPVCSPSRAGLMTGRYQQRFGHEYNFIAEVKSENGQSPGLPLDQITLADAMKRQGYVTGMVGKWHLGMEASHHPLERGFDEFFGFQDGGHRYLGFDRPHAILRGKDRAEIKPDAYLTDVFSDEALSFVDRHQKEPFFLYLAYNAPHTPLQAPEKYLDQFAYIPNPQRRAYAAMVYAIDVGVGAIQEKLKKIGLWEDTLIFFISDNGGWKMSGADNGQLRGNKGRFYEGGCRVPYLVQWPAVLPAGKTYHHPVSTLDVFATAVAAAASELPQNRAMDGVNLVSYLTGQKRSMPHEYLCWRESIMTKTDNVLGASIRSGKWKMVKIGEQADRLYDFSNDIGETNDVAHLHPGVVQKLNRMYNSWDAQMIPPRWPRPYWEGLSPGTGEHPPKK